MFLEQKAINKVVLLNADVLSPKVSKKDRNSNPLIGDGAAVTIIEKSTEETNIFCSLKMNGAGAFALHIPAGGAKLPISEETSLLVEDANGNLRSKNHLVMKGDEVFNFVQSEVPGLVKEVLEYSKLDKDEIDFYLLSQSKYKIIPNSSFSWWASWLSQKNKITIAPNNWFSVFISRCGKEKAGIGPGILLTRLKGVSSG